MGSPIDWTTSTTPRLQTTPRFRYVTPRLREISVLGACGDGGPECAGGAGGKHRGCDVADRESARPSRASGRCVARWRGEPAGALGRGGEGGVFLNARRT